MQILTIGGPRFVVLYGSNGTGKTIVLFQCLVMLISSIKLKGDDFEVMAVVGADSIKDPTCGKSSPKHGLNHCGKQDCEESQLLHDLKSKYLGKFEELKQVRPKSFQKACDGKLISCLVLKYFICEY